MQLLHGGEDVSIVTFIYLIHVVYHFSNKSIIQHVSIIYLCYVAKLKFMNVWCFNVAIFSQCVKFQKIS